MNEDLRGFIESLGLVTGVCALGLSALLVVLNGGVFPNPCPCPPSTVSNPLGKAPSGVVVTCSCPGLADFAVSYDIIALLVIGVVLLLAAVAVRRRRAD